MLHRNYSDRMLGNSLILALLILPNSLLARTVHYDPAVVEFTGKLTRKYFPGPPNYESVKEGDDKEGALILELDQAFNIEPTSNPHEPPNSEWEKKVKVIQIVLMDNSPKNVTLAVGKNITVRGRLFHALTGHHHTRVLMELDKILEH